LLRFYRFGDHLGNRQRNGKLRAAFGAIARLHSPAMLENDLLYDGQPQAGAVGLGREKGAKHFLQRSRGNAWAAVDHANLLHLIVSDCFDAAQNENSPGSRGITRGLGGVASDVQNCLSKQAFIAGNLSEASLRCDLHAGNSFL